MGRVDTLSLIAVALLPVAAQDTPTVFKTDVRLVRLLATVKDVRGNLVGSLKPENFKVTDSGVEQKIAVFERQTAQPLSVSILIDNSGSTAKDLKYETDSVSRFLRSLLKEGNPEDQASVYTFNWQVVLLKDFTRRLDQLEHVVKGIRGEAGTSLYDAMYIAAGNLSEREGRHVMIIVTDGGDTTSAKNFHQALEAAQMADAVVYPILVMPITNDAGRNIGGENALTSIAAGTGGRVFAPSLGNALDDVFSEILGELRTQYLIGYYPKGIPPSKNRFHPIKLVVDRPGLRVSTRSGYYGDSAQ